MNIIDYIPIGRENAISRRMLCNITGLSDRMMRHEIERARKQYAILNSQDGSGYFLPSTEEKPLVERWIRQERHRSKQIGNSTLGAEKWLVGDSERQYIAVPAYVRRKHKIVEPEKDIEGQLTL
jgi:hypothetical protein